MQRALALSLIQVYADVSSNIKESSSKPILFFLDEPETFLHPRAQYKLLDALEKISEKSQIFIVTHSPYLLRKFKKQSHSIHIFSKDCSFSTVKPGKSFDLFGLFSPTWGEINFFAFGVLSVEFHNELYGFIQAKAIFEDEKYYYENDFDEYLKRAGIPKDKPYIRLNKDGTTNNQPRTLPTFIRNVIHHPENPYNSYTQGEHETSVNMLIQLL